MGSKKALRIEPARSTIRIRGGGIETISPPPASTKAITPKKPHTKQLKQGQARSTIRIHGGGIETKPASPPATNVINPPLPRPQRTGLRYQLTPSILGKLEALARARYSIRKLVPADRIFTNGKKQTNWEIAQSVNASCEIEGEGVSAEKLKLALNAGTEPKNGYIDDELERRMEAIRSIYETYVWALTIDRQTVVSFDFVLELHERMLKSTRPDVAGKLKTKPVHIRGAGFDIATLPVEKTERYLRALCERTDSIFVSAHHGNVGESLFLTTAEFILDFLSIHPFTDGNGRLARLLSTYMLERSGYHFARFYPIDKIVAEQRPEYYAALYSAQLNWYTPTENLTSWIRFYVEAVYEQSMRALRRIHDKATDEQEAKCSDEK